MFSILINLIQKVVSHLIFLEDFVITSDKSFTSRWMDFYTHFFFHFDGIGWFSIINDMLKVVLQTYCQINVWTKYHFQAINFWIIVLLWNPCMLEFKVTNLFSLRIFWTRTEFIITSVIVNHPGLKAAKQPRPSNYHHVWLVMGLTLLSSWSTCIKSCS